MLLWTACSHFADYKSTLGTITPPTTLSTAYSAPVNGIASYSRHKGVPIMAAAWVVLAIVATAANVATAQPLETITGAPSKYIHVPPCKTSLRWAAPARRLPSI